MEISTCAAQMVTAEVPGRDITTPRRWGMSLGGALTLSSASMYLRCGGTSILPSSLGCKKGSRTSWKLITAISASHSMNKSKAHQAAARRVGKLMNDEDFKIMNMGECFCDAFVLSHIELT
jgi:hypothetical protein